MAKQLLMLGFKPPADDGDRLPALHHHRDCGLLTGVPDVPLRDEAAALRPELFRLQHGRSLSDQSIANLRKERPMLLLQRNRHAALQVVPNVGVAHAERTQDSGEAGNEDISTTGQAGDAGRVQGARPAARHQREASRVQAFLDADVLNRMQHRLLGEAYDSGGGFDRLKPKRLSHVLADGLFGKPAVERDRPASVSTGPQTTEQQLCIRDGRVHATALVAHRAGIRSCPARTDRQHAAFIHRGDRSATGAHCRDLDGRDRDAQSIDIE